MNFSTGKSLNRGQLLGISGVKRMAVWKKTGLLSHRAFRRLVLVLLMSLMDNFPEIAPLGIFAREKEIPVHFSLHTDLVFPRFIYSPRIWIILVWIIFVSEWWHYAFHNAILLLVVIIIYYKVASHTWWSWLRLLHTHFEDFLLHLKCFWGLCCVYTETCVVKTATGQIHQPVCFLQSFHMTRSPGYREDCELQFDATKCL